MKPTWDKATLSNIKELLIPWESSLPRYPDINYQGVPATSADLYYSLENLIELLEVLENVEVDAALYLVHTPGIKSNLSGLLAALDQYVRNMGAAHYAEPLISSIWSVYSSLIHILPKSDLMPSLFKLMQKYEKNGQTEYAELYKTAKDVISSAYAIESKVKNEIEKSQAAIDDVTQSAQELKNLQITAQTTAVEIEKSKRAVDNLLANFSEIEGKGNDLLAGIVDIQTKAETALSSATQVALAESFKNRKLSLEKAQGIWVGAFCTGLAFFFIVTLCSLIFQTELNLQPLIIDGHVDAWGVVSRLLVMSPVIWFTWFSVKRYGSNVSLIEDYAFKEASALAFVGYSNNMQSDPEMIKLLRESAIKNFAYAPSRLIGDSHSSPLDEAISSAMKDRGIFDRLIKLLQVLKPTK